MSDWLPSIIPAAWLLKIYIVACATSAFAVFYILEQLVIYHSPFFSNITAGLYRSALALMLVGLVLDTLDRVVTNQPASVGTTLLVIGLAILTIVIAVTHKHHHRFERQSEE